MKQLPPCDHDECSLTKCTMTTPPTLQQLAEAAAREITSKYFDGWANESLDKSVQENKHVLLKHLAPLEAQLVEVREQLEAEKKLRALYFDQRNEAQDKLAIETMTEKCSQCGHSWHPSYVESGWCIFCILKERTQERDEARREVERLKEVEINCMTTINLVKTSREAVKQKLTTENQQLKARVVELEKIAEEARQQLLTRVGLDRDSDHRVAIKLNKVLFSPSTSLTHYQELERKEKE